MDYRKAAEARKINQRITDKPVSGELKAALTNVSQNAGVLIPDISTNMVIPKWIRMRPASGECRIRRPYVRGAGLLTSPVGSEAWIS